MNYVFELQTTVSCTTRKSSFGYMCASVSPQNHTNESPQANESYEGDLDKFYFRTSKNSFVHKKLLIFGGYVCVCFT